MKTEHLSKIVNAVSVPVVVLDSRLAIVAANSQAHKAFAGLSIGMGVAKAVSQKRGFLKRLGQVLEQSVEKTVILKTKRAFGQEFLTTIRPLDLDKAGLTARLLLTFEDRSPLKDVKTMRSEFVANVSHEIRSPLTAITGLIETLQGAAKDDPQAQAYFLDLMAKEANRMVNLVTDLLSLSQVEVKQRRRPKKLVDPNQIIAQAINAVGQLAEKRGMTLAYHAPEPLPDLPGQRDDLVRVFINLLENAIFYGRKGGVIQVTADVTDAKKPDIVISVQDQGEGIPAADIPHLTERFYRADKSRSRNVGGTGLGLAIVKHVLVRHRGKMEIDSTPGQGSTFSVYLPLAHAK
jgi:two-component system phosphate regulon sensor histidine kinase PhoR